MAGNGGKRVGAGRPKKLTPTDASAALLTAAVYELSIGQSSVEIALNSKGAAQPSVKVYHKSSRTASRMAQAIFDDLLKKYCALPDEDREPKAK
jgi:hypothetical protein